MAIPKGITALQMQELQRRMQDDIHKEYFKKLHEAMAIPSYMLPPYDPAKEVRPEDPIYHYNPRRHPSEDTFKFSEPQTCTVERKPSMNYSLAIFLISDKARMIGAVYEKYSSEESERANATNFKTFDPNIKVGDYVVVETDTRFDMTVCKVVEVDIEPDFERVFDCKWIVGVVERADFDDLKKQEADAILRIRKSKKREEREKLAEALRKVAGDDLMSLPIYDKTVEEAPKEPEIHDAPTDYGKPDF